MSVRTHTPSKLSKVQRTFVSHPLGSLQVSGERITAPSEPDLHLSMYPALHPRISNFEIALNLSPVRADSIRMSLQLISRASRTVPLPLSMGLSSVLPQLIPWLIQLLLAAKPITGKRWVLWRLRCHTGGWTEPYHQLRQSCLSA
jgi:hypothetical protein